MKKKLYKRLEEFFAKWHKRAHPWPGAAGVDYPRYAQAIRSAKYCYWQPWGWLPWAGFVIKRKYGLR